MNHSPAPTKTITRDSNIELLRIISMIMILMVHFDGATFKMPEYLRFTDFGNLATMTKVLIESFAIIGVNCFVLISGYFGIKFTIKGLVNFILWVLFYSIGIGIVDLCISPNANYVSIIGKMFGIFSQTDLWFVPAYLALYIIAPIINKGLNSITQKEFIFFIIGLTFLNVYLGWWYGGRINDRGYNVMQLIYIYALGRYIGRFLPKYPKPTSRRTTYIFLYIISFLCISISLMVLPFLKTYAYNSPFVICASICFFLIFTSFRFSNKFINNIAISAFAVYLIHKNPFVWIRLRNLVFNQSIDSTTAYFASFWIISIAVIFFSSIIIDKIRIVINQPIATWLSRKLSQWLG